MKETRWPDYVCTRDEPYQDQEVEIGLQPFHLTLEISTHGDAANDPNSRIVELLSSQVFGVCAQTDEPKVELNNLAGARDGGIPYEWGWGYDVLVSADQKGVLLEWNNETRWLERKLDLPVTRIRFGFDWRDGDPPEDLGPPIGWEFRNRLLTIMDGPSLRWTRDQHQAQIGALCEALLDLDEGAQNTARRKLALILEQMEAAL